MNNSEKPSSETGRERERAETKVEEITEEEVFDELKREQETSLFEKYAEKEEFSDDLKEVADKHLLQEADEETEVFAVTWAENNRERIKSEKGVDIRKLDMSAKIKWCREQGGFEELKTDEQYEKENDEIKNIHTLLNDLKKDSIPVDSQFLILNRLSHRIEKKEKELKQAQKQGKEIETAAKEGELKELLQTTQEISEKIAKSDLGKNAEDKGFESLIKSIGEKEDYIKDRFSKERDGYVDKNLEDELGKIGGDKGYLQILGYSIEAKGFLRKRTIITNEKGNQVYVCARPEGAARFLKTKGEERVKEDLEKKFKEDIGSDWEDLKTTEINKAIRKEVKSIAGSPEKAEKGIESLYQEARQKLVEEFKEEKLKKELEAEKGEGQAGKEEKETKKESKKESKKEAEEDEKEAGESVMKVMDDLLRGEGDFKGLEGRWATDQETIRNFCDSVGVSTEHLDEVEGKMRKKGMVYEKRKKLGLVGWLIELMLQLMLSTTEGEEKK